MGEEFNLLWADSYVPADTVSALNKYQKVNHFPGMSELAKKNLLAKNMNRMIRALPGDFTFVPQTFQLPAELEPLRSWASSQKRKPTIIVKPDAGCQVLTLTPTLTLTLTLSPTLALTLTLVLT